MWSEDAFCGTPGWGAIRLRWTVLDSDEYWVEPPREVVPDKRYVWKLKKALNG